MRSQGNIPAGPTAAHVATTFLLTLAVTTIPLYAQDTTPASAPATEFSAPKLSLNPFDQPPKEAVYSMSLEDLMNVEVSSVSRIAQNISQAAAAVTVIDQDQIHRSGMTSIPDLLRLVPGMDVARVAPGKWAISARGFNSQYSDKLLVLMDGRTIYDPLFTGVFWQRQDYVLADLEKIEVIRGPGATIWGSNAVNGVINITTKSARDTQGFLANGIGGSLDNSLSLRYGGKIGNDTYYRVYAKSENTSGFQNNNGKNLNDGENSTRAGFRIDKYPDSANTFTVQGDYHYSVVEGITSVNLDTLPGGSSGNILGRWVHSDSPESGFELQVYFDHVDRMTPLVVNYRHDALDLDFEHHFPLGSNQVINWGFGGRAESSTTDDNQLVSLVEGNRFDFSGNGFVQDDVTLVPKLLHFIAGSKFTYTSYDDFQIQPSARFLLTPNEHNTIWGAVSRAIHTPGLGETSAQLQFFPGGPPRLPPNPKLRPEVLTSYELGYRSAPVENLSLDMAVYYNRYERLLDLDFSTIGATGNILTVDRQHGHSYGGEIAATYKINSSWRVAASYSVIHIQTAALFPSTAALTSPKNQVQLHSYYDINEKLSLNASAFYVGGITNNVGGHETVDPYVRLDIGLSWRPAKGLELGIVGQNLLEPRHKEFTELSTTEAVPRSAYVYMSYSF